VILAPSLLAADFGHLSEELARVERGGAGLIHVDVMDGHFVPNLTMGPVIVAAVRRNTRLPIDVHLMIAKPDQYIDAFVEAGASWVSVHLEAGPHVHRTVGQIRKLGARPGVVLNPATPLSALEEILPDVDFVLLMSVNPGFGGQAFIPATRTKISRLRAQIGARQLPTLIEVDGGVDLHNARSLAEAGADVLVAGSAVFGGGDGEVAARRLIEAAS
jgi:ribulose-phosphate 3-epimerase